MKKIINIINQLATPLPIEIVKIKQKQYHKNLIKNPTDKLWNLFKDNKLELQNRILKSIKKRIDINAILKYEIPEYEKFDNIKDIPIFLFRYQGEDKLPEECRFCLWSIKKHANGHPVIVLSKYNLHKYGVTIPQRLMESCKKGYIGFAHISDYVRIELLSKHRGLYLDFTIYCINDIPDMYFELPYFSIKPHNMFDNNPIYADVPILPFGQIYCMCGATPRLFYFTHLLMKEYYSKYNHLYTYYMNYYMIHLIYEMDKIVHDDIDMLPYNNENVEKLWMIRNSPFDEVKYNKLCESAIMFKLSFRTKNILKKDGKETFYSFIKNKMQEERDDK